MKTTKTDPKFKSASGKKRLSGRGQLSGKERLFKMVSVGVVDDPLNRSYDIISTFALLVNLTVSILFTFTKIQAAHAGLLQGLEAVTVLFFTIDYVLRLVTAPQLYPELTPGRAVRRYIFSLAGIIDLLSFLPHYLPFVFPTGAAAFRMFRVARIFRLFRINAYYDSLNVITEVLQRKKQQLFSSIFIIGVLMVASSLVMYGLEHEAQPDVFKNAFSGIWWSASTLLTVGYGDIYPVTQLGKAVGIAITFLGVGMVAIPTGIISAGFVEQYQRLKNIGDYATEEDLRFISVSLTKKDSWTNRTVAETALPKNMLIAAIVRGQETIIPRGDTRLEADDQIIIGAEPVNKSHPLHRTGDSKKDHVEHLQEIHLQEKHPWNGLAIRDLDISRRTLIVMIRRNGTALVPSGDLVLKAGDEVVIYTRMRSALGEFRF